MRITNQMKQSQLMFDLNRLQNDVFISQRVLNSGKEIERPSDDPARARKIMLLRSQSLRRNQYEKNISDGIARLSYTETQLTQADNLLKEARTLTIQGTNGGITDQDRKSLATRVDQLLHEMITVANSRNEDQYIFGGFNTQEAPYRMITDPTTGDVIQVQDLPDGMDGKIYRVTADGEQVQVNVPGSDVFQTGDPGEDGDIFQVLVNLRDALNDGIANDADQDPPTVPPTPGDPVWSRAEYDSAAVISESLDKLDAAAEVIREKLTFVGSNVKQLMNSQQRHQDLQIQEDEHLSQAQDADLAEWITKFQMQTIALQQAMQVGSKVLSTNLVNFIG